MSEKHGLGENPVKYEVPLLVRTVPTANLWRVDNSDGKLPANPVPLGYILGSPQGCAKSRPGYLEALSNPITLKAIYLKTSEWIKEIIYTDDYSNTVPPTPPADVEANYHAYRQALGYLRLANDAYAHGCGILSRNVTVTNVKKNPAGVYVETVDPKPYSSLAIGAWNGSAYLSTDLFIYPGDWTTTVGTVTPVSTAIASITDIPPDDIQFC